MPSLIDQFWIVNTDGRQSYGLILYKFINYFSYNALGINNNKMKKVVVIIFIFVPIFNTMMTNIILKI